MFRLRSLCLTAIASMAACTAISVGAPGVAVAVETEPEIDGTWVTHVTATSANLQAEINPGGTSTSYFFEYLTYSQYLANGEQFTGAATAPASGTAFLGYGNEVLVAFQHLASLPADTKFAYRVTALNSIGTVVGEPHVFATESTVPSGLLPDHRAWELVSPIDKNGGAIQGPGANAGGDVLQAASQGGAVTYSSSSSFADGPVGAPPGSQYISTRSPGGWTTVNVTIPALSGSYGREPTGVPYQLFSPDLSRGLVLNGEPCRGEGSGCPVANPPVPGSGAPAGYQNYYLRDNERGTFTALLTSAGAANLTLAPGEFHLKFVGASPDLNHVVVSTCAKLTPDATEVPGAEGCEPSKPNLYMWTTAGLELVNVLPGATLAAQRGAISEDGSRVYFFEAGKLYLREPGSIELVAEGPGLEFQTAVPDGTVAFYTKGGHLYRYDTGSHNSTDLSPTGGVTGVLGTAQDGSTVYYEDGAGLERTDGGGTTIVSPIGEAAQPTDFLPGTAGGAGRGTARVSADGEKVVFLSKKAHALSGYDNTDNASPAACEKPQGICDSQVYLYEASTPELLCVSCNASGSRPLGPSTIPGAILNGSVAGSTEAYEPRVLSHDGNRLFFDSGDALLPADTNGRPDVYQWESEGEGSCNGVSTGCLGLISSGRGPDGATFVDASADGVDAYLLTDQSLVGTDPGSTDIYDARIGGGLPEPPEEELCSSDECAPLPATPEDPTVGTLTPGPTNPPLAEETRCPKSKQRAVRHGKITCVPKRHKNRKHHHGRKNHDRQSNRTNLTRRTGK